MNDEVISLEAARAERRAARIPVNSTHPSLRWVAGEQWYLAHRRGRDGNLVCGAEGDLVLAPPGTPPCRECFTAHKAAT